MILRGVRKRDDRQHRNSRVRAYELASLIGLAFNSPDKFPKPDAYLGEQPAKRYANDDELRAFFKARSVHKKP